MMPTPTIVKDYFDIKIFVADNNGKTLTSPICIVDFFGIVINENARHKNTRIAKTVHHQLEYPAVFDGMLID